MRRMVSRFIVGGGARTLRLLPAPAAVLAIVFAVWTLQIPGPAPEAPRGEAADAATGPLHGVHVVVDAGHGGHDRGACHFPSALIEKEINLDMAFRLEAALLEAGAHVTLTRRDDTFLTLDERAGIANERQADLFVSLHVNRYPSADCFGAQTFYLPSSEDGRRLAFLIQEELLKIYPPNYRQALPGDFRVLRGTHMPAALVEIGFVTSPVDRQLMAQAGYREQVADAIVEACIRFVRGELPAAQAAGAASVAHQSIRVHP